MPRYLSDAAEDDLRSILLHMEEQSGLPRALILHRRLESALERLSVFPFIGRTRVEFDPAGRRFRYATLLGSFIAAYRVIEGEVRIARIVHGARNVATELERNPGDESVHESMATYVTAS